MNFARTAFPPGLRPRLRVLAQRLRRSRGASAVEYGLMIAFITIAILGGLTSLGVTLRDDVFQQLINNMQTYLG
jgi:Flp pilus assembly pilin Flp